MSQTIDNPVVPIDASTLRRWAYELPAGHPVRRELECLASPDAERERRNDARMDAIARTERGYGPATKLPFPGDTSLIDADTARAIEHRRHPWRDLQSPTTTRRSA